MSIEPGILGAHLREHEVTLERAVTLEKAGYGTLWLDALPSADLTLAMRLLDATSRLAVGTSVVNAWFADPHTIADAYHRIVTRHPDRFLLGMGIGHREVHAQYTSPYQALVSYLDTVINAGVPPDRIIVAALGPRMLRLVRDRVAGTVTCMVTPEHTRRAREILGPDKLVLPGHFAIVDPDTDRSRTIARSSPAGTALRITNYANNLQRLGFTEDDLAGTGSDRIVDALALHGDATTVAAGLRAHLDSGADHVGVYPLGDDPMSTLLGIAEAMLPSA